MITSTLLKKTTLAATLCVGLVSSAMALEVAGQQIPERAEVGGQSLMLDGAGLRKKVIFDVYVAALYTPSKIADGSAVIKATTPRRVELKMLRGVGASTMHESFVEGLQANTSDAELAALKPGISALEKIFNDVKKVEKGDLITLDFLPGKGTQVTVHGKAYPLIEGDKFASAMLSIWLGTKPVQSNLKDAMLGKTE